MLAHGLLSQKFHCQLWRLTDPAPHAPRLQVLACAASCRANARARLFEKHTLNDQMLMETFAEVARGGTAGLAEVPAAQLEELRDDPVEKDWGPDLPAAPRGTLLLCAARHENVQAVELLLGRNVNVDATNEDSQSALYWAARVGSVAVVTRLLDKGASLELASKTGNTPLMQAAIFGKEAVAKLLLEMGASADTANKDGWTALMAAAQKGHEAVVQLLLDKGAAVDAVLKDGHTALIIAAQKGHAAVAKVLLDKGAALRTSHAVKQRLCSVECGDGRVAAVDEDCRARRQQKPAHGLQLGGRDAQLLLLLLHCSAIFPVRLSAACVRQGVAHAVQAARRAGEARVGRVDFFRVRAIFASAARAFFPTRGNFGNHIFSGVLVPIISQEGSGF